MVESAVAVEIGYELYKIADRNGWMDKLKDVFRTKHRVLLLGATGVGKTQFLHSFGDMFAAGINHAARTDWATSNRVEIKGNLFEFIDTPGQKDHQPRRSDAILNASREGFSGVINLVSYGYHESGERIERVIENNQPKTDYLEAQRKEEIRLLSEWAHLIKNQWVFTVITKADLWWDQKDEVIDYYKSGIYQQALLKKNPKLELVVSPYSSISSRYYGVVPTSGNFNDEQRRLYRSKVIESLLQAIVRIEA